jgi:hypothetical protein
LPEIGAREGDFRRLLLMPARERMILVSDLV